MTNPTGKNARLAALDFTKGMLVLIMVLYHWINYFFAGQDNRYLRSFASQASSFRMFIFPNMVSRIPSSPGVWWSGL